MRELTAETVLRRCLGAFHDVDDLAPSGPVDHTAITKRQCKLHWNCQSCAVPSRTTVSNRGAIEPNLAFRFLNGHVAAGARPGEPHQDGSIILSYRGFGDLRRCRIARSWAAGEEQ